MGTVIDGNVEIKAESEKPVTLQVVDKDGAPDDITNATRAEIRLQNVVDNTIKSFATDDTSPQLVFLSPRTDSKIKLSQVSADFPVKAEYIYFIIITDSEGNKPVPDDTTFNSFKVGDKF